MPARRLSRSNARRRRSIGYLSRVSDESLELMQRLVAGDMAAVEPLLKRYLPGLRAWVRSQSGPELNALESHSDLCQTVCREVLEKADRFRHEGEGAFRHWLYTTASRKIRNKQRYWLAQRRDVGRNKPLAEASPSGDEVELIDCYASICTPSEDASIKEELQRIEAALSEISEEHREVIRLSKMCGLSHAEVAERMNRSEGAVRGLLFRALASLASKMNYASDSPVYSLNKTTGRMPTSKLRESGLSSSRSAQRRFTGSSLNDPPRTMRYSSLPT